MADVKETIIGILLKHGKLRIKEIVEINQNLKEEEVSQHCHKLIKYGLISREIILQSGKFKRYVYYSNEKSASWLKRPKIRIRI